MNREIQPIRYAATMIPILALVAESVKANAEPQRDSLSMPAGHEYVMANRALSVRDGLTSIGVDLLSIEAQQNPAERYFIKTTFVDRSGNQILLGVTNTQEGMAPNPTNVLVPTVHIYTNNNYTDQFQLNAVNYPNIGITFVESISVASNGLISMGVYEQLPEYRLYKRGGSALIFYDNFRDYSRQIRLPDAGLDDIEINGLGTLVFINNGTNCNYLETVTQALDSSKNGQLKLDANCTTGSPISTRWIRQELTPTTPTGTSTPRPVNTFTATPTATGTETPKPTSTSTVTATVFTPTPRETPTPPVTGARMIALSEMPFDRLGHNWSPRIGSLGTFILSFSSLGAEVLPQEGPLLPSFTNYTHALRQGVTGVVCEGPAFITAGGGLEFPGVSCIILGTESGLAPKNPSIRSDLTSNAVTIGFRAPSGGGQTSYIFRELISQRNTNLDSAATSVTFTKTGPVECGVVVPINNTGVMGNGNVVCSASFR